MNICGCWRICGGIKRDRLNCVEMLSINGFPVKVLCFACRFPFTGAFRRGCELVLNLFIVFAYSGNLVVAVERMSFQNNSLFPMKKSNRSDFYLSYLNILKYFHCVMMKVVLPSKSVWKTFVLKIVKNVTCPSFVSCVRQNSPDSSTLQLKFKPFCLRWMVTWPELWGIWSSSTRITWRDSFCSVEQSVAWQYWNWKVSSLLQGCAVYPKPVTNDNEGQYQV